MYYRKEMTEKARAVIAGEIDIPCPIGWHTLYESKQPASRMAVTMALAAPTYTAGLLGAAMMRRNGAGPSEPVCCT